MATTNQFGTNRKPPTAAPTNRLPTGGDPGNSCLPALSTRVSVASADDCRCMCSIMCTSGCGRGYACVPVVFAIAVKPHIAAKYSFSLCSLHSLRTHGFNVKTKAKTLRQVNIFGFDFNMPTMD